MGWSFRVMLSYPGRKVLSTIKLMTSGEGQAEHIFSKPPLTEFSSRRNKYDGHPCPNPQDEFLGKNKSKAEPAPKKRMI